MIKKFIILFLIVLLIAFSFVFFKKDDKYKLPSQYKIEIQKVIDEETPKTKIIFLVLRQFIAKIQIIFIN